MFSPAKLAIFLLILPFNGCLSNCIYPKPCVKPCRPRPCPPVRPLPPRPLPPVRPLPPRPLPPVRPLPPRPLPPVRPLPPRPMPPVGPIRPVGPMSERYTEVRYEKCVKEKLLYLTPYIERNQVEIARSCSEVVGLSVDIKSYSGFFTVNKQYQSNMFFWFFPAMTLRTDVPIVLWLQGGPGGSSMFGLFNENGPFIVNANGTLALREYSWNREFALLYIDNPVGTGFSFTRNEMGYSRTEIDVADNLYVVMQQFFSVFYEYKGNSLYLAGEAYAGKYLPAFGHKIYEVREEAISYGINLQGFAIGDGFCDPRNMLDYGNYLYQFGLIDEERRDLLIQKQKVITQYIDNGQYDYAQKLVEQLLPDFYQASGYHYPFNILYDKRPESQNYYIKFLNEKRIREIIHVGDLSYTEVSASVHLKMKADYIRSVKPWIEELLDANYRMLFYSGQLDAVVAPAMTENFLQKLKWHGVQDYKKSYRGVYKVKTESNAVAGYVRHADNLYQAVIRNAGHMVPYDQPKIALDMITRFIKQENFY